MTAVTVGEVLEGVHANKKPYHASSTGSVYVHDRHSNKKKDANHILIPQVIFYFISVPKLLSFWYRYEITDHLRNQYMICFFFLL